MVTNMISQLQESLPLKKSCVLCGNFISIYKINRTLHGRLGIRILSSSAESISHEYLLLLTSSVCAVALDLGFLIDGSSSIERYGRGNFGRLLNFVKSLVSFFPISRRETRVGVILYTHRAIPIFSFTRYYTRAAILQAVDNLRYPRGGTRIGKALSFARRYLYR